MNLDSPDHIEIIFDTILVELNDSGWWHATCVCGVASSSTDRKAVDSWAEYHSKKCEKTLPETR